MKKILIADDKEENRYVISNFFKLFGTDCDIEVLEASSGKEAFEIVKKEEPELLIIDIIMESQNAGIEVIDKIRETPGIDTIQIWVVTAQQIINQEIKCDEFILKPFDLVQILEKCSEFLGVKIPEHIRKKLDR